jgi:predicted CXXCH cytochrome family protein
MKANPVSQRQPIRFGTGWCGVVLMGILLGSAEFAQGAVARSKHDLSVTGTGGFKAVTDSDICIFCHTPHRATLEPANHPLWNRSLAPVSYTPYSSSTMNATVGQPNGASKLCLSCHDGTVALGIVNTRPGGIPMQSGASTLTGPALVGTDLSGTHPVSFRYDKALADADGHLMDPATLVNKVRLDKDQQVQCTSCHDPHNNDFGDFLVQDPIGSALCVNCHIFGLWAASVHSTSGKTWNGAGLSPWAQAVPGSQAKIAAKPNTPAGHGCASCHASHSAGSKALLLRHANDELNCYSCHAGTVAAKDLKTEFDKPSVHPITATTYVHNPKEDPLTAPRHVKCVDCHNPHATRSGPALQPPMAAASLAGVKGVTQAGTIVQTVTREYELCFRCHADSLARGRALVPRQFAQTSLRLQFASTSASFHPVVNPGKNANVPSLLPPYTTGSLIYCTDCHNNDQGPGAGGSGPRGPHGSAYPALLERQLITIDGSTENPTSYALCYKCHDRDRILSDLTFSHRKHVVDGRAACTTCHDPHGVAGNPRLINFNTLYVKPSGSKGTVEYNAFVAKDQACTLTCHGVAHPVSTSQRAR